MNNILIIGAGGVGRVVAHKVAQNRNVFKRITLVSRTFSKCELIKSEIGQRDINIDVVDADDIFDLIRIFERYNPEIVINVALPYQDLTIMEACLQKGIYYLDTANYEHPDIARFEYKEQWAFKDRYKEKGIMALLGSGFDPGVTNIFCAYANQYLFDEVNYIDILDCNDGDNGHAFATNFNPEINLREVSANGKYWENGQWIETKPMEIKQVWDYPQIGKRDSYLLYHEEMESLVENIKSLKRIRFFMTFSQSYLTHLKCFENIGLLGIKEIDHKGQKIVPMEFLKTLLPDPSTLGSKTKGKTNIGCVIEGIRNGKKKKVYIYNICDHEKCYAETKAQAVSYTTGVPAMIGTMMIAKGIWKKDGVFNMEEFDAKPFMEALNEYGLPWKIDEIE